MSLPCLSFRPPACKITKKFVDQFVYVGLFAHRRSWGLIRLNTYTYLESKNDVINTYLFYHIYYMYRLSFVWLVENNHILRFRRKHRLLPPGDRGARVEYWVLIFGVVSGVAVPKSIISSYITSSYIIWNC